jgi:small subunit ribosomal protein S20
MANTQSAAKRARGALRRRLRNQSTRSKLKSTSRHIRALAAAGNQAEAAKMIPAFQSEVDKASKSSGIHRRTASRYKSRISKLLAQSNKS